MYNMRNNEMTSASGSAMENFDVSTSKLFFSAYFIVKVDVALPLIPM
jgi:hypothetical protein